MKFSVSSLLLFLLLSTKWSPVWSKTIINSSAIPSHYESVYMPIGAGQPQWDRKEFKAFGSFPEAFTKCGEFTNDALNEGFTDPSDPTKTASYSNDLQIVCEPSPTRVLVSSADQSYYKFERDMTKECELFVCSKSNYDPPGNKFDIVNRNGTVMAKYPAAENKDRLVCGEKQAVYPEDNSQSDVSFTNEANCFEFDPNLIPNTNTKDGATVVRQVPRWLPSGEDRLNLRHFYFADEKSENLERVPFVFSPKPEPKVFFAPCDTTCDEGRVVKIGMPASAYSAMIYIDPSKCDSFRICFDPLNYMDDGKIPECKPDYTIDVLFKNGVVVWGKKGRASTIELMSRHMHEVKTVAIEFGYGVKKKGEVAGEFYVGNMWREFVESDSNRYGATEAQKLAFFFPTDKCLKKKAGIFSKNIEHGKLLYLGANPNEIVKGIKFDQKGEPIVSAAGETATTTTKVPVIDFTVSTTPAPPRILPEAGALSLIETDQASNTAVFIAGKWWTWGLYIGFVIGTLLTLGIGSGVFYLLRRTVFSVWYRGMYKRYGCDASGTTGGITGIGFGNTTAGVETIAAGATGNTMGGASTMGGTTGGTSTMGGTSSNTSVSSVAM